MSDAATASARPREPFFTPRRRRLLTSIVLALICAIWVYPLVWMIAASFKPNSELFRNPGMIPIHPTLENYARAWTEANIQRYFFNTLFVTVGSVVDHHDLGRIDGLCPGPPAGARQVVPHGADGFHRLHPAGLHHHPGVRTAQPPRHRPVALGADAGHLRPIDRDLHAALRRLLRPDAERAGGGVANGRCRPGQDLLVRDAAAGQADHRHGGGAAVASGLERLPAAPGHHARQSRDAHAVGRYLFVQGRELRRLGRDDLGLDHRHRARSSCCSCSCNAISSTAWPVR